MDEDLGLFFKDLGATMKQTVDLARGVEENCFSAVQTALPAMPWIAEWNVKAQGCVEQHESRKTGNQPFEAACSAVLQASAWTVRVGFRAPLVPITDAPRMPRFGASCEKPQRSTTLLSGASPIRVPP